MNFIPLVVVDDAALAATNVPENDHVLYSGATTYAAGSRVRTADHGIFQSRVGSNTGNDPANPANVVDKDNADRPWIYVSKTNRFRAFDGRNSAKTRQANSITYDLTVSRTSDTIVFMGLEAVSIRVQIVNSDNSVAYDNTRSLIDTSEIVDWFSYYTWMADEYETNSIFYGIPAYPGTTIRVTISAPGGVAGVAVIGYGRRRQLGETLVGTTPGIKDYSTKETDIFGEKYIVERPSADTITFNIAFPTSAIKSIRRALKPLLTTPAIYYESEELPHDLIAMGFYTDFSPVLMTNYTLASIEITGVI